MQRGELCEDYGVIRESLKVKDLSKHKDDWLKRQQRLPVSDIAEEFVSVTDIKHYVYCPRLVYFDRVLHATPVFGSQQEEGKESHEDYIAKELGEKTQFTIRLSLSEPRSYCSPRFVLVSWGCRATLTA